MTGTAGTTAGTTGTAGTPDALGASGTGGTTGMSGTTGAAGIVGANVEVCQSYCTTIMSNCTGVNQQYSDMANCMKVCSYMPAGMPGDDGPNSAGCRANAATAAALDTAVVKSKCLVAGPLSFGGCGADCALFCSVAVSYCPSAYASLDDCYNTCNQFSHVTPGTTVTPGLYSSMYTPGPTPETSDTLDCRAYYLFIQALPSAAAQAMYCPDIANTSPACGMGYVPPGDAGTDTSDAQSGPNAINAHNWNETTIYPLAKRRMLLRDESDPHVHLIDLGNPANDWSTVSEGPWAQAMQLIGNSQVLGGTSTGYQVFDLTDGHIVKTVAGFANTASAYRMANGETMLTQSGTVLTFLDKDDKETHQISYPGYSYVRLARPTRNGTFLVPSDTTVFEGDAQGNVLWSLTAGASGWGHIWEPLLLGPPVGGGTWNDGDTLLCTAFGSSCDVIDKNTHMVTFRYGTKNMPNAATFKPNFFAEFEILPNGNIIVANWQGHGEGNGNSGIQVIEFSPAGDVVWYYQQDPLLFASIEGVMVLDGKDPRYLHVQETSTDSTWQPVIPTP